MTPHDPDDPTAPDLLTEVAGLRCLDVLDLLPDHLDGSLDPSRAAALAAHVAECDNCARFGRLYGATVQALGRLQQRAPTS